MLQAILRQLGGGSGANSTRSSKRSRGTKLHSDRSLDSASTRAIPSLHGHLMNVHQRQDPQEYYETLEVLGEGSMGSVCKVKKRLTAIGGSARPSFVKNRQESRRKRSLAGFLGGGTPCNQQPCFLFCPFYMNAHKSRRSTQDLLQVLPRDQGPGAAACRTTAGRRTSPHRKHSRLITHGRKDVLYALKTIHLDRVSSADFMSELENEVSILKDLDHPNIVKAIETYSYRNQLFIIIELCSGGDLYSRDPYREETACKIVRDMLSALSYMHSRNITHRDLKYENIMFTTKDSSAEVKLIDFGLSKKYAANQYLHDTVGTVYTMAPELLKGHYTSNADVWSMGVIAFMLLSSSMPFFGRDRKHVVRKIVKGKYQFASRRWAKISTEAKNFITFILQRDPTRRPTAEMALIHPWLTQRDDDDAISENMILLPLLKSEKNGCGGGGGGNNCDMVSDDPKTAMKQKSIGMMDEVQATIQAFADYDILKKLALMIVAYKSTDEEIGFLRQIFNKYDGLKDGEVSLDEFKEALKDYLYSDEELERIFSGMDMDGTGVVHYSEFLAATIEAHGSIDEERLAEAFDRLDTDDSGYITVSDLKDFLGEDIPLSYLDEVIDAVDMVGDHQISYDEFLAMWDHTVDEKRKKNKEEVRERRMRRIDSKTSTTSMLSTDSCVSTVDDTNKLSGSFDFMRQKAISIRSQR